MASNNKLIRNETLIGIFAAVTIGILVLGINFLKGDALFSKKMTLYADYEHIDGLNVSNPILLNGYKVGSVKDLLIDKQTGKIKATFNITEPILIPANSIARIRKDLLGAVTIQLELGKGAPLSSGASIIGANEVGLAESVNEQIQPIKDKTEHLLTSLDSIANSLELLFASGKIQTTLNSLDATLRNFESTTASLDGFVKSEQPRISGILKQVEMLTTNLNASMPTISRALNNLAAVSDTLAAADIKGVLNNASLALQSANTVMDKVAHGNGSVAQLMNDPKLYNNLQASLLELEELLKAFRNEPSKYMRLRVSLFGKK
jgi:phospholipid/cholesterol/gamma-HCH transport system substrate-binding protein